MARTGESYQLICTAANNAANASSNSSVDFPTISWMLSGEAIVSNTSGTYLGQTTTNGTTNSSRSVLLLDPLSVEHNGNYTCQATLNSLVFSYTFSVEVATSKL